MLKTNLLNAALAIVMSSTLIMPAMAAETPSGRPVSVKIDVSDLDFADPSSVETMKQRAYQAASRACGPKPQFSLVGWSEYKACRKEIVAKAELAAEGKTLARR